MARRVIRLDELLVEEKPLNDVPRAASAAAMLDGVRSMGIDALPWDDDARDFQARCEFVRQARSQGYCGMAGFLEGVRWRRISPGSSRFSTALRAVRSSRACRCSMPCVHA